MNQNRKKIQKQFSQKLIKVKKQLKQQQKSREKDRTLYYPQHSPRFKSCYRHYASQRQLIYSPFQKDVYFPPHLQTSFKLSMDNKFVYISNIKKAYTPQNYEKQYLAQENRIKKLVTKKYKAPSKIKYLLDQDRQFTKKPRKLYMESEESLSNENQ